MRPCSEEKINFYYIIIKAIDSLTKNI